MLRLARFECGYGNRLAAVRRDEPETEGRKRRCKDNILVLSPASAPQWGSFADSQRNAAGHRHFLQQSLRVERKPAAVGREERGSRALGRRYRAGDELVERPQVETRLTSVDCRTVDQQLSIRRQ